MRAWYINGALIVEESVSDGEEQLSNNLAKSVTYTHREKEDKVSYNKSIAVIVTLPRMRSGERLLHDRECCLEYISL